MLAAGAVALCVSVVPAEPAVSKSPRRAEEHEAARPAARDAVVERVVDGDTLLLVGRERIRLLGVDAPELRHRGKPGEAYGAEAARYTSERVRGVRVTLHFDLEAGLVDRYGRTLAYVTLPDGELLNLEIIRAGFAEAYHRLSYEKKREFLTAERDARVARRGLWAGRRPADP